MTQKQLLALQPGDVLQIKRNRGLMNEGAKVTFLEFTGEASNRGPRLKINLNGREVTMTADRLMMWKPRVHYQG